VIYAGPDDFAKFMAKSDTDLGATMKAVWHRQMTRCSRRGPGCADRDEAALLRHPG
jgi:hypothetical protein